MPNHRCRAVPQRHCHIQEKRSLQFFRAIERWALRGRACYPMDFFSKEEFSSIASCDYCTMAVLATFNFAGECEEPELSGMLKLVLQVGHPHFGEKEERERSLCFC